MKLLKIKMGERTIKVQISLTWNYVKHIALSEKSTCKILLKFNPILIKNYY